MVQRGLRWLGACAIGVLAVSSVSTSAQDDEGAWAKKKTAWVLLSPAKRTQAQEFAEDYKSYLNVARSALTSQREMVRC
jgi:hypothetical protein